MRIFKLRSINRDHFVYVYNHWETTHTQNDPLLIWAYMVAQLPEFIRRVE